MRKMTKMCKTCGKEFPKKDVIKDVMNEKDMYEMTITQNTCSDACAKELDTFYTNACPLKG